MLHLVLLGGHGNMVWVSATDGQMFLFFRSFSKKSFCAKKIPLKKEFCASKGFLDQKKICESEKVQNSRDRGCRAVFCQCWRHSPVGVWIYCDEMCK